MQHTNKKLRENNIYHENNYDTSQTIASIPAKWFHHFYYFKRAIWGIKIVIYFTHCCIGLMNLMSVRGNLFMCFTQESDCLQSSPHGALEVNLCLLASSVTAVSVKTL